MGKSFILKNRQGSTAGYLTEGLNAIHLRVDGVQPGQNAIFFYQDGTTSRTELEMDVREQACPHDGKALLGAVVVTEDGSVMADSGAQMRTMYDANRRKSSRQKEESSEQTALPPVFMEKQSDEQDLKREIRQEAPCTAAASFPERRWPPPPCWQGAAYKNGRWTQE